MKLCMLRTLAACVFAACAFAASVSTGVAQSGSPAQWLRTHAEAGTLAAGEQALARRVASAPDDAEARAAWGFARFALAIEKLGQSMHRHGLRPPRDAAMALPILRLPVPLNANPEPISPAKMRAIYATLLSDLNGVETALSALPAGDYKLRLNLNAIRLDLNGDGAGAAEESLGIIVRRMMTRSPAPTDRSAIEAELANAAPWNVAFDRADAIWLRGYAKLISVVCEFALAHDWSEAFHATAQLFFPRVEGASELAASSVDTDVFGGMRSNTIADTIAFIHMIRFPVTEPARMARIRTLLLEVVALSRENWKAILAESDDEDEWLPSPRQTSSAFPGARISQEIIDNWHATLSQFESALEGKALVGHWRFTKGFDLRLVFEQPRTFDFLLWMTGHAALPYLKEGPALTQESVREWQRMFGGNFFGFAVWFN